MTNNVKKDKTSKIKKNRIPEKIEIIWVNI